MRAILATSLTTLFFMPFAGAAQPNPFAGDWLLVLDQMGPQYLRVTATVEGSTAKLAWDNENLECTLTGNVCEGWVTENGNAKAGKVKFTVSDAEIKGEGSDLEGAFTFTGKRPPTPPAGGPRTLKFEPAVFHNYFAWNIAPALNIFPGDTVETKSVDAGGIDENGVRRARGGNPLTGPFYVEGAWPGDTLVVHLKRVRLNRGTAGSGTEMVGSALAPYYLRDLKMDEHFSGEWTLDREHGVARPAKPSEHMKDYVAPLKPMLGCIGVAPPQEQSFRSGYLGPMGRKHGLSRVWRGCNALFRRESSGRAAVPGGRSRCAGRGRVNRRCARDVHGIYFFRGLDQRARAEYATRRKCRRSHGVGDRQLPARGLQQATTNLSQWLAADYKLTPNEVALVLGTAIRYDIAEVVDPLVHVVARIDKKALAGLGPH